MYATLIDADVRRTAIRKIPFPIESTYRSKLVNTTIYTKCAQHSLLQISNPESFQTKKANSFDIQPRIKTTNHCQTRNGRSRLQTAPIHINMTVVRKRHQCMRVADCSPRILSPHLGKSKDSGKYESCGVQPRKRLPSLGQSARLEALKSRKSHRFFFNRLISPSLRNTISP